ncbi:MAG: 2-hydroxyglutaryl-CoA dehydratase, partial [Lachnospiraceae bacterium]|nr:2-hydroxyglutaryl-CoA dehydratase [Lachnospiraceae bacterium]
GRDSIGFAYDVKTEISCHARGAHYMDPAARTIIDIGGQDSKVIILDAEGNVRNFIMNDKCAAGTGRFLENMARTLETDMDAMSAAGLSWKKDLTISSTCTVFAESEVVSLVAENAETPDIIHALNKAVAKKTSAMALRMGSEPPYLMTGGVARNAGVAAELSAGVGAPVKIAEHPDLAGAIGAALYAMKEN